MPESWKPSSKFGRKEAITRTTKNHGLGRSSDSDSKYESPTSGQHVPMALTALLESICSCADDGTENRDNLFCMINDHNPSHVDRTANSLCAVLWGHFPCKWLVSSGLEFSHPYFKSRKDTLSLLQTRLKSLDTASLQVFGWFTSIMHRVE